MWAGRWMWRKWGWEKLKSCKAADLGEDPLWALSNYKCFNLELIGEILINGTSRKEALIWSHWREPEIEKYDRQWKLKHKGNKGFTQLMKIAKTVVSWGILTSFFLPPPPRSCLISIFWQTLPVCVDDSEPTVIILFCMFVKHPSV